ncbi:sigma-54 dependent transcriptional regulator [Novosphingobium sp.]|uniref:sigma-54 interaction domain-containing protein n=1 Tax=Novosphingobium sp. TaxID=1874826 RepID=UPI00286B8827|nr:sigma-54 dependent transcriptional regulator [Novosphingobium sp.]
MAAWQTIGRGSAPGFAGPVRAALASPAVPCGLVEGDRFVGISAATERLRQMIARLGAASATTLIHGETGTGKEIVALLLHRNSPRAAKALVPINCAAIPEAMIEGELFGYEKGAFSSAIRAYPGKFGLADGGTLFLDEIGELSLAAQAKILRALEAKEVFPLGSMRPRRCNVRIIAATNRDLAVEVRAGRFRADLYYRLAVVRLDIPPLAARREDIAPIARHLVAELAREMACGVPVLDPAAIAELQRRNWPGNVRELRNALEHALVVADNPGVLRAADLPPALPDSPQDTPAFDVARSLMPCAAVLTRDSVIDAIRACDGQKAQAARMLRVSRTTLYRYLQRHTGLPAIA